MEKPLFMEPDRDQPLVTNYAPVPPFRSVLQLNHPIHSHQYAGEIWGVFYCTTEELSLHGFFVALQVLLSSSDTASTTGSNETNLATSWCVSADSWRCTNMLMVSTTMRMLNRLKNDRSNVSLPTLQLSNHLTGFSMWSPAIMYCNKHSVLWAWTQNIQVDKLKKR